MLRALQAESMKVKPWFWFLVFLGPFGVISLQLVNYGVRYDWIMRTYPDVWGRLLSFVNIFVAPGLLLGMAILASQLASLEHKQGSWTQILALPVKRRDVFVTKFLVVAFMILISSVLLFFGTILLGVGLGFGWNFPLIRIAENSFYPMIAGLPVLALQVWLSIVQKNQAVPLTVGIFGAVFSMYSHNAPDWVIWKWPLLFPEHDSLPYVGLGLIVGIVILSLGVLDFKRRDIV
ncbi:ABC transporter permease [Halobacillus locisalis]|uniref:ABC transporter permease n=1 Tax=Halobacillus locisalis TaxID=220753 RepID=A0A838CSV5_9BACI|nr:ABC transporter permease [Halobacillus locisalis]MBA2175212.1 ABC transporter permease [Halobacillus locisalis]